VQGNLATSRAKSSATSYEIQIGDTLMSQPEVDGVQQIVVEDHVDMVAMATIEIGASERGPAFNFKVGDMVTVKLGSGEEQLFKGDVTALEPRFQVGGTSSMTLRALDHMHRLGRGRMTRFWEDRSDSDVVEEVGTECGLSVEADPTGEQMPYILQRNESNVGFLKRLAARNNFLLTVELGVLKFKKASFMGAAHSYQMGQNLRNLKMSFNSVDQVQKVVVRGWDPGKKMEIVGTAELSDIERIGTGQLGAELSACFGDSTAYVTDIPVRSQRVANQIAKAELERIARQFCRGTVTVQGDDTVRAGNMIEFSGLSTGLNDKFYIVSTRHVISAKSGYSTDVRFCSNTMGN
jgi:phage protein D